ncbi:hypothetical protein SapgrDRAFT_3484 [Saprospira grandis DSM 2844]|uniref:Uncharacterized protein n=1 Tax=Saprospira grandis DSM 2844 TaxID=694433 RepID=J1I8G0_9BACT|nr:hypothetical protein SapgrDRAFT_3484 [Saprospira grandis DSM 2844]
MKSRRTEKPNTSFSYKNFLSTPSPEKKPEKVEGLMKIISIWLPARLPRAKALGYRKNCHPLIRGDFLFH